MTDRPNQSESAVGDVKSYVTGFALSIALTLLAFVPVYMHADSGHTVFSHTSLVLIVIAAAILQLIVQAYFFLHLSRESKPRWNLTVFAFMILVVFIVVFGSLWIMQNLDYRHPQPAQAEDKFIMSDEGIHH